MNAVLVAVALASFVVTAAHPDVSGGWNSVRKITRFEADTKHRQMPVDLRGIAA